MKKIIILIAALIAVFSFIGCEEEASAVDFLSDEDLENLFGIEVIKVDELGLLDPPEFIAEIDGVNFIATNQIAQLSGNTLRITFISEIGSVLTLTLQNPASMTYTAGVNSDNLFVVDYDIGDGAETYTTSPDFTNDSMGSLGLAYTPDLLLESTFNFIAINRADGTEIVGAGEFRDVEVINN